MKKQLLEPDFIGGQGKLTKEEESVLTKYFADKKAKLKENNATNKSTKKRQLVTK